MRLISIFSPFTLVACGQHNGIKPQDPIRCRSCGYRILYKVRTKRSKSFFPLALPSVLIEVCRGDIRRHIAMIFFFRILICFTHYHVAVFYSWITDYHILNKFPIYILSNIFLSCLFTSSNFHDYDSIFFLSTVMILLIYL